MDSHFSSRTPLSTSASALMTFSFSVCILPMPSLTRVEIVAPFFGMLAQEEKQTAEMINNKYLCMILFPFNLLLVWTRSQQARERAARHRAQGNYSLRNVFVY